MYLDEFHCVVVGAEPAGLWLLKRLAGATDENGKPLQCAWIRHEAAPLVTPIATIAAKEFGLTVGEPWHAELVTRRRNLVWKQSAIETAFPGLPDSLWERPGPGFALARPGALSAHRKALEKHPELLGFASGLWKALGRTPQLQPEVVLWSTLLATELALWDPGAEVPEGVTVIEASEFANPLEEVKSVSQGSLSLKFKEMKPIVAKHWVLNLPFHSFSRLSAQSDGLSRLLTTEFEVAANRTLYRFQLEAAGSAVPLAVPPLAVAFDAETIPDWDTEIWPFRLDRYDDTVLLELVASAPPGVPLDAVLERFRGGMRSLGRLFPFLPGAVRAFSAPLSLESCYDEAARNAVSLSLEQSSIELYAHTSLHTATRHKSLSALFPSVYCSLPYPLGPLVAAQRLVPELLGKPKKKVEAPAEASPPPT